MMAKKVSARKTTFLKTKSAMKVRDTIKKKTHQLHMIESTKEVTLKTRETCFLYGKPKKLKNFEKRFPKTFSKNLLKISLFSVSHIVPKKQKVASYRRIAKLGVSFRMGYDESKFSFLRTFLRFYSVMAILEPQIYVVSEQFGAENISLLSRRLVDSNN